jgi:UDP-N-acetylmuramate--alanine ligase
VLYQTNRRLFGFSLEKPSIFKVTEVKNLPNSTEITILNSVNPESIRTEKYEVKLFGKINVLNSLAVISTLRALGFTQELVQDKISQFSGIKRRFEILGEANGITVIDDYAHHPTAVNETLKVAKEKYANQKVWAVFEPHTFSRTEATIKDLATSFDSADHVIIAPIYAAREKGSNFTITDEEVKKQVSEKYPSSVFVKDKQEALDYLLKNLKPTDVVVVMAVGSFNRLGYELLEKLQNK